MTKSEATFEEKHDAKGQVKALVNAFYREIAQGNVGKAQNELLDAEGIILAHQANYQFGSTKGKPKEDPDSKEELDFGDLKFGKGGLDSHHGLGLRSVLS